MVETVVWLRLETIFAISPAGPKKMLLPSKLIISDPKIRIENDGKYLAS